MQNLCSFSLSGIVIGVEVRICLLCLSKELYYDHALSASDLVDILLAKEIKERKLLFFQ